MTEFNLSPQELALFEGWRAKHQICYWFTNEARRQALDASPCTPWSYDACQTRLAKLKNDIIKNGAEEAVKFFENLRKSVDQYCPDGKLKQPAVVALAEENEDRLYRVWFQHFDAWYESHINTLETQDEYAF